MLTDALSNESNISELSIDEVDTVSGGLAPLVLVAIAAYGLATGAGIYYVAEWLN